MPSAPASPSAAGSPASGADVVTIAGPTCPAQQQGQTCSRPIAATVVVSRADGSTVTTVHTGGDGTAHVPLAPGPYTFTGQPGPNGFPRPLAPQQATVPPGSFIRVEVDFDTGIR
jgi:hypothetical protein